MAVLEADADGGEAGGEVLCSCVDLVQACAAPRERAHDLVYEHGAGEASVATSGETRLDDLISTHLRPTILPWLLPTATSSPMMTNLTRSALLG